MSWPERQRRKQRQRQRTRKAARLWQMQRGGRQREAKAEAETRVSQDSRVFSNLALDNCNRPACVLHVFAGHRVRMARL